jgi:hypothetical protein
VRVVLLTLVAMAGCASAGCGHHAGVPPTTWAGSVCGALTPWRDEIGAINQRAATAMSQATTPGQTRTNLVRMLSDAARVSERARAQVAKAGVPEVVDGARIAGRFVAALAAVRDAYGRARDTIAGLPIADAKSFYDEVSAAVGSLNKEYTQAGLDTARLASAELRRSFDEAAACS